MNKKIKVFTSLFFFGLITISSISCKDVFATTNNYSSTWEWNATKINSPDTLVQNLKEESINTLFVNTGYDPSTGLFYLKSNPSKYDAFIQKANKNNISVQALYSNNDWALISNYNNLDNSVKDVLNYNTNHKGKFSSVHLDIEPYALSNWDTNSSDLLTQYVTNLTNVKKTIDTYNSKYRTNVKLSVDIPFWYNQYTINGKNALDVILSTVDEVNVMDYTQNPDYFRDRGLDILNIADKYSNKKVIIGSEFQLEYKDVTLYYMSKSDFDTYTFSYNEFIKHPSFKGLAAHNLESYTDYLKQ